ncbi:GntR family transcriptional regulator [Jiangella alkaliphila]|uniref:GntR family transcriptional regulator n=1 Tax=Jiangella alkaliphila TaxID=419479 RepID=A0A1H2GJG5_9ACTN|nr:GntR family transcriptional regulator [Jiangella alkaliphila]SDU19622.1 GntR family transcriptional regulator [Jiangella alkaliphila]
MSQSAGSSFPYRRIVDDLRTEILSGRLEAGEQLPSENDLAHRYKTSRPTVRRAIAVLRSDGLVVTEQGRGAFVRRKPHVRFRLEGTNYRRHRSAGQPGFNAQAAEQGQTASQQLLEVTSVPADAEIALRLDLDPGELVVVRRRLFIVDDQPIALCNSFYPAAIAAGTAISEMRLIKGGAHAVIEDPEGPIKRSIARSVDELVARMPTAAEIAALTLPPGEPVVRVVRTIFDATDEPVEVQETIAAADRHEFRYEVAMR